jgi:hypothetical protein
MGVFGILGGLLLFAGDMLFYYDSNSTDFIQNMGNASDFRIKISGLTALFASWFYLIGLGQVYYAFQTSKTIIRQIVLVCFSAILVSYGVIHAAYVAIATSSKLAIQHNLDLEKGIALALETNDLLRLFVYPFFAVLSVVFITQVLKKNTLYPKWMVFFFPLIPFLFQSLIGKVLLGNLKIIILGGYLNLLLVIFFTASTIALWHKKKVEH